MRVPAPGPPAGTVVRSNWVRSVFWSGDPGWNTCLNVGDPSTAGQLRQRPRWNAATYTHVGSDGSRPTSLTPRIEPLASHASVNVLPPSVDSYRPSGACSGPSPQPRPPTGFCTHGPVRENAPPVTDA